MTLQAQLDTLREALPSCKSAAYGDLSAQLILRSSTDGMCPREVLNVACQKADKLFGALAAPADAEMLDEDTFARSVVCFDADMTEIFARQTAGAEDVVLVALEGGQPIAHAISHIENLASALAEPPQ